MDVAAPSAAWPPGSGEMAGRIREHDWAGTPLGPPEAWPPLLRAGVALMLAMPQLASIAVGPERILLYDDLAAGHFGARHPGTFGRPIAEGFADQWALIAGFYDQVFAGESVRVPAQPVDSAGTGAPDVYDATLTPLRGDDGEVLAAFSAFVAAGDRIRAEASLRASEERQAFSPSRAPGPRRTSRSWKRRPSAPGRRWSGRGRRRRLPHRRRDIGRCSI